MKKTPPNFIWLLLVVCCAGSSSAGGRADDGGPANWCRNGAFTRDSQGFGLALVKGKKGARVFRLLSLDS